jgi:uncharacterized protein YjbI with pentapeptide repeats
VGADLAQADLKDTNLSQADFTSANLENADFQGASLFNAVLDHADLLKAHNLQPTLYEARTLSGAKLPDGSIHP